MSVRIRSQVKLAILILPRLNMHSPTPKRIENTLPSARSVSCVSTHLLNVLNVSYHLTGFCTEAHDLEACNLQLLSLGQSW